MSYLESDIDTLKEFIETRICKSVNVSINVSEITYINGGEKKVIFHIHLESEDIITLGLEPIIKSDSTYDLNVSTDLILKNGSGITQVLQIILSNIDMNKTDIIQIFIDIQDRSGVSQDEIHNLG